MPKKLVNALSPAKVTSAGRGYHADGGGLYLQVAPAQGGRWNRSWVYRFRSPVTGRTRDMGLGPVDRVKLADARDKARALWNEVRDGNDPIEQRRAKRAAAAATSAKVTTFDEAAIKYIAERAHTWKDDKSPEQWRQSLRDHASPILGKMAVRDIETKHVIYVLDPIWRTKHKTAARVRGRIEQILDWCRVRGERDGENPARWRGHIEHALAPIQKAPKAHLAAMPYDEVPAFLAELRQQSGSAIRALELTVLTACRTSEVLDARWDEFDLRDNTWTIPRERMKSGREHRVPLSDRALAIIKEMAEVRQNDFVFPGQREGRPLTRIAMMRRMKDLDATVHGFRSTFRDWAAECTAFPREVAEQALAHSLPSAVEASYRRSDLLEKRRALMQAWSDYCAGVPVPEAANVTPIRKAK